MKQEDKIIQVLKQGDNYPLDDCYEICKNYKMTYALSYICIRKGGVKEAIQNYIDKIMLCIDKYIYRLQKYPDKVPKGKALD